MTYLELGQAVLLGLTIVVAIVTLARYFGGRARSEMETLSVALAARDATLKEKDILIESKDQALKGQGERLAEKDKIISEMGGTRVGELLVTMQEQNLTLFATLTASIDNHEARAAERHSEIAQFLRNLNGKDTS